MAQSILQKPRQSVLKPQSILGSTAEVVFVLDRSGSMRPIFDQVRDWVAEFVSGVGSAGSGLELRYGFLCYNAVEFHRLREYFSESNERFAAAIKSLGVSKDDEITLPAIDAAADFPWSATGHRFIVALTDEATETGYHPDWQRAHLDDLKEKLMKLRIKLWLAAPPCPTYRSFSGIPHFEYKIISGQDFENPNWLADFMRKAGSNVSKLSQTRAQAAMQVRPDLYELAQSSSVRLHAI